MQDKIVIILNAFSVCIFGLDFELRFQQLNVTDTNDLFNMKPLLPDSYFHDHYPITVR